MAWLDEDGDGTISAGEASTGLRRLASVLYTRLSPYKHSLLAGAGFICTFYGSNFKYTILFGRTFATTGWPTLKPAIRELAASYRRGGKAAAAHAPEIEQAKLALSKMKQDMLNREPDRQSRLAVDAVEAMAAVKSLQGVLAAIDPKKVWAVLKSAYVGISASFASVLSESAARLGVGVGLGEAIGKAINAIAAPFLTARLRTLRDRALKTPELQATLEKVDVDDATLQDWADSLINVLSTALGIYVAHRVDDVVYLYSACVAGATIAIENVVKLLPDSIAQRISPYSKEVVLATFAAAGFAYQRILGKGQIPLLLKLPLTPVSIVESILDKMAINIRATSLLKSN